MSAIQLKDGTFVEPDQEQIIKWQRLYPDVDVYQEINAMIGWCDANPSKRKTARGLNKFINSWLKRAQDGGGHSPFVKPKGDVISTRDMTMEQMMDTSWAK